MTSKTTFWNFLKINTVEIPIIQRDYAQGRLGKENLRKNFLGDLRKALDNEPPYKDSEMKLDFVYGSEEDNKLNPLDGQQRLTTLWLLHWYIALRAGVLNETNCVILRKFTYETRISSREFCQNLCMPENFEHFDVNDIVGFLTKQTWFYSAWKQDPTIQSMLRMLGGTKITDKKGEDIIDGIEELFIGKSSSDFEAYWNKLIADSCPIVFYDLPLQDFGLTDDLYIKMNARGKQLTSFENFKADLIGYITKNADEATEELRDEWKSLLDIQEGLPIKFDTDWTDIFWTYKSNGIEDKVDKEKKRNKENQIDEIFFAFLNRFFWNELFVGKKSDSPSQYILEIGNGDDGSTQENENASYRYLNDSGNRNSNDYGTKIAYQGLDYYKYDNGIPIGFFEKLKRVLNNYYIFSNSKKIAIPECPWDKDFRFIPQYVEDKDSNNIEIENNANEKILKVTTLTQVQRIVFFAICKYFDHDDSVEDDEESMKRWLRVVWNLVSGQGEDGRSQIRSTTAIRTALEHIDRLDSHNVYESLKNMQPDEKDSDFSNRWNEEINKAKQILDGQPRDDGQTWESIIIEAEHYAFFKGGIRFLFQNENGDVDWSDFDQKFESAKKYFTNDPVPTSAMQEKYRNADLLKLMIGWFSKETFDKVLWWKHRTFNNKPETWLYYLLNNDNCYAIHHLMIGDENNDSTSFKDSEKYQEKIIYYLANTTLLDYVIENIPNSWIRDHHNHKAIYPRNTGVFLNADKRDDLLSNTDQIKVDESHKIDGSTLLFGSDINFTYNNNKFQWYRDDNVYLMNDDWDYMKKSEDEYFSFDTESIQDSAELFYDELTKLIKTYSDKDKLCPETIENTSKSE